MTSHSPQKCAVCGDYHCLSGCVPVEQCQAKADIKNQLQMQIELARKEERQKLQALWGEFSDSEDYDLVSDYWKRRFSTFLVSWP